MAEAATSTAYGPAILSALEQALPKVQRILDDPYAIKMLPSYARLIIEACKIKPVRQLFFSLMEKNSPGIAAGIVCRKRYVQDKFTAALSTGITSLVILGAGLDTLAYRIPQTSGIQVYEVDLPTNIVVKRQKLEAAFGRIPTHVKLVSLNFEDQNLETELIAHGYSLDQQTFVVWEGVTQYLTESAVRDTMQFLAKLKSGSQMVFTYALKDFIDGKNNYGLDSLYQRFVVKNTIWLFGLNPNDVASFLAEYGWQELEQVGPSEYTQRYLNPANRTQSAAVIERAVYAEKR
jgi:methyltransferase (TIGR00027 family)